MTESQELLAEYAREGSEAAFREIVKRYINFVYATALRLVDGDAELAQDVTQTVFVHLARKARRLSRQVMLGGWLHRDTCYVAIKAMRGERRRRAREHQAVLLNSLEEHSNPTVENLGPVLDQAINLLGNEDRTAILLCFFEQRDFRSVGAVLGASEDAARMRVGRALTKLQSILRRRGVSLSAAALTATLTSQTLTAAPAGLAASVAGAAIASSAASGGLAATFVKLMVTTKLKAGIAGAIVVTGIATPLAIQHHHAQLRLRDENQSLRQQIDQFTAEARPRSITVPETNIADERMSELLRLRAEVAMLRKLTNEFAKLREENRQLRASLAGAGQNAAGELETAKPPIAYASQRGRVAKLLSLPLLFYASDNQQQLPATFEQTAQYFSKAHRADPFMKDAKEFAELTKDFEIVYHGSQQPLTQLAQQRGIDTGSFILIRERQAQKTADGKWIKAYGMADGSGQIIAADPDGSFDYWENTHLVSPTAANGE